MNDGSSRPHRCPHQLPARRERRIIKLRFISRWGAPRIAAHLKIARSTVEAVLRRYRMPLLRHLDQNTGLPMRRPEPHRYEHAEPGDLVHVDIKKLGRIPDGGGHRKLGRTTVTATTRRPVGLCLPSSRRRRPLPAGLSEILSDERKETAADSGPGTTRSSPTTGSRQTRPDRQRFMLSLKGIRSDAQIGITHNAPGPTGPRPTAKSSDSTAPWPPSGPMPRPTPATKPVQRPTPTGYITTITIEPTPASADSHHRTPTCSQPRRYYT